MRRIAAVWIVVVMSLGLAAQTPAPEAQPEGADEAKAALSREISAVGNLIETEKYDEALSRAEAALVRFKEDYDLCLYKVQALKGLRRFKDAARAAVKSSRRFPGEGIFLYEGGDCAYRLGNFEGAIKIWSRLFENPEWAGVAAIRAARAHLLRGKEEAAEDVFDRAIEESGAPSAHLLVSSLQAEYDSGDALSRLETLKKIDGKYAGDYEELAKLYRRVSGGRLFRLSSEGDPPFEVPLKEKSERRDIPSLVWGGGDVGTATLGSTAMVVVPVSLNGTKERWMLLDSGAQVILINPQVVEELGLEKISTAHYIGLGAKGAQESGWVLFDSMKIGPVTVSSAPALVIDEKATFWEKVVGIVPTSLFRDFAMQYDRRGGKLTLHPSGTSPESVMKEGTFRVESLWPGKRPYVATTLAGHPDCYFLVDTGAHTTFISAERAESVGITVNSARYATQRGEGLSGTFLSGVAENLTLDLGNARFEMPTVQVAEVGGGDQIECYGILGRLTLDKFEIFFDYHANVVAFRDYDK